MQASETPELSILMPCLDEVETLATCIDKAQRFLRESGIRGEVVIADNGSKFWRSCYGAGSEP